MPTDNKYTNKMQWHASSSSDIINTMSWLVLLVCLAFVGSTPMGNGICDFKQVAQQKYQIPKTRVGHPTTKNNLPTVTILLIEYLGSVSICSPSSSAL